MPRRMLAALVALVLGAAALVAGVVFTALEIGDTQDALCDFAYSSAATKDRFIDVMARAFEVDETNPFIVELRGYVAAERDQLAGECPAPPEEP